MRDEFYGMVCQFLPVIPKAAQITYFPISPDDKTKCPTWEPEENNRKDET